MPSSIRYLSTECLAAYAISVRNAWQHTLSQYGMPSSIRYLSTRIRYRSTILVSAYANSVQHT
eukprot:444705-Rhodomonas_salina.1